ENDEVDFVVVHRGKLLALEVKSGKSSTSKGLQQFKKLYPDAKTLIVGNEGLHWKDFLKFDPVDLF
ncbi:MAG: AAA family ATPase, partial [Bacteroidota bacterium]|nr:AAA family ATPase [Bacteroidota bacterium]